MNNGYSFSVDKRYSLTSQYFLSVLSCNTRTKRIEGIQGNNVLQNNKLDFFSLLIYGFKYRPKIPNKNR